MFGAFFIWWNMKLITQLETDEFSRTKVVEVAEDFHKEFPKAKNIRVDMHISYAMEEDNE